ncbi:TPA: bifunctional methylenetetrahydrofolate dehydrogenase/methenyltetrahydrofolate cyclohydrolase [Candidatus Nomurabacteria bacterium]|nr:bifunctional methylenetetrahydrofolate dehydrogenase/methenyltetrahydrofolate cyclohydrolase [Candidatus Nomurabacteria bacterium]
MNNKPLTILNGTEVAKEHEQILSTKISELSTKPHLVIIQVGNNPASTKYIQYKKLFATRVGATVTHTQYEDNITENDLVKNINSFSSDASVHGIIVQLPLPKTIRPWIILDAIDPKKDVDGMTSFNLRHVYENNEIILPATTKGIFTLLSNYNISLDGKNVVVVGRSSLVGKPTALASINRNATVTICHSHTKDLASITKSADILIVAIGQPNLIKEEYIKENCVIVDVGITVGEDNKVSGDVLLSSISEKADAISPVPGGVGPMTIVSLFENLLQAYNLRD